MIVLWAVMATGNWQLASSRSFHVSTGGVRCYRYVGAEELRHSYLPTQNSLRVFYAEYDDIFAI
jgi:hypothetical protein